MKTNWNILRFRQTERNQFSFEKELKIVVWLGRADAKKSLLLKELEKGVTLSIRCKTIFGSGKA